MLDARPQCLGPCFFCRKSRRKTLCEVMLPLAVGDFAGGKNTLKKTVAIAGNGMGYALDFHNVDSGAYEHEKNFFLNAR
jgi:hypothetical protein